MKIEITPTQLDAIIKLSDDVSSFIGSGTGSECDKAWLHYITLIDRMLEKNGCRRNYQEAEQ